MTLCTTNFFPLAQKGQVSSQSIMLQMPDGKAEKTVDIGLDGTTASADPLGRVCILITIDPSSFN